VDGGIGLALTVATGLLDVGLGYLAAQLAQTALPLAEVAEPMDAVPLTHAIYRHLGPHAFVSVLLEAARGGRAWPASVLAQSAVAGARFSVDESELSTIFGAARTRATEPAMRAQLRMNEARALLRCGQRQGALAAMESVVGDDPRYRGYPHWWLEIGGLNATLGNVLRALACYQAAQELGADRTEVAARRSHMYMKRGEWSKAAETWSATPPASQSRWNGMGYLSAFVAWMWRTVLGAPDVTDRSRQEAAEWCRAHNSELDALTDDIGRAVFLDPTNLELLGATADLCRKRGDASLSFVCDLTAAMIMESNPEPWATAWLLLAETKLDGATQEAVSIAILDFVGPLIGGDLIRVVRRLVGPKLQPNLAELEAQLDALRESAVPRTANIVTKDGVVSIDLTDTSEP
jgi:tetratricopeptide (TPR) repeat protein